MEINAATPEQAQLWSALSLFVNKSLKAGLTALDIASAMRIHANQLELSAGAALHEQGEKKISVARITDPPRNGHHKE